MKVIIVKCSDPVYWYFRFMGAEVDVIPYGKAHYELTQEEFEKVKHLFPDTEGLVIEKTDCEVIEQ